MNNMRCWADIDLASLERNITRIRAALPKQMKYVSVVKADAYGHGIHPTATRLMQSGVDLFAVANVKEAVDIREMGSGWPILVLGPLLEEEDQALIDYDLIASLSNASEIKRLVELSRTNGVPIKVHLKIDTGMGRMGAWWEDAPAILDQLLQTPELLLQGILTHFPDPSDYSFSLDQRKRFLQVIAPAIEQKNELLIHADNSSSLRSIVGKSPFNAVRIGLLQFGVSPPKESLLSDLEVEPVLSFHSKLALVKKLPAGTSLSYGREHKLAKDSTVGIIAAGYGDAIPLHCGDRACALIHGKRYPLVGRVTMDQTIIDLSSAMDEITPGTQVTLIGQQKNESILLTELAEHGQTIAWELLCSITKRVPRVYLTKRE
ncbi:alanine racemase [Opitutales bacterium]|nr:alanine racemase [Opitutales bacterium]